MHMTIGINGYEAVVPRFGHDPKTGLPRRVGSGEYCFELLVNLNSLDKKNKYIIYLPQNPTIDLPQESNNWHYKIVRPRPMWTLLGLSLELLFGTPKADVFFSPTHYLPLFLPIPSAVSVLDLSYIHFPSLFKKKDLYQLKSWTAYSIKNASTVFTISQASKDDIIKTYKVSEKKVIVTYPGIKSEIRPFGLAGGENPKFETNSKLEMQNSKLHKGKYGIEGDYILFVGTLQPRKNIVCLIEAFSRIKREVSLVIVGKKGWLYDEILEAPKKFNVEKRVKFLDFVENEDLQQLYKKALCFALPSLYEGFGLPVLEAMKYGCPVLTSNVSSLPEAGGDAALYVNPLSVEDIAKKLELLIEDEELRKKLIEKGYKQVKKFSWEKTACETLKSLEEIADKT